MKALILSDIHSNILALEAIWAKEKDSDFICCTGDLVDWGPHPKEVIDWMQTHDVPTTKGNHDAWVSINCRRGHIGSAIPQNERGWENYNAACLSETDVFYLENLPESLTFALDGITYGMTHLVHEYDEIVSLHAYEAFRAERFDHVEYTRLILGHTHRQAVRHLSDDLLWLNPGSASYRRRDDPDQTAHYMTIVDGRIHFHRLEYNFKPLYQLTKSLPIKTSHKESALRLWEPR